MAHSTNIISSIKLPNGNTYEIHDAQAIHSAEELGLSAAMVFKGTKATVADLPSTSNKTGDVWHVTADDFEYVWTDAGAWEELGRPYNFASDSHVHDFSKSVTLSGTASGNVTVPTVSKTTKYIKATASNGSTDVALGEATTFTTTVTPTTTNIKATASGTAVGANGTANAITGFGAHATDTALGANATFSVSGGTATTSKLVTTTVKNPTVTAVSIPNVTNAGAKGTAASWNATVTNGVLEFSWTANTPTTPPTLGTALSASSVTTSNVTVATGSVASTGTGSAVATGVSAISVAVDDADEVEAITALGTPTTAVALTGVKVTTQPTIALATGATSGTGVISVATGITSATTTAGTNDRVSVVTGAPTITLAAGTSTDGTAVGDTVTIGSTTAALTGGTASVSGTVSGTTGQPK